MVAMAEVPLFATRLHVDGSAVVKESATSSGLMEATLPE